MAAARDDIITLCAVCVGISCAVSDDAPLEACVVLWGVCNHAFHSHCVTKFLKTSKDMCVSLMTCAVSCDYVGARGRTQVPAGRRSVCRRAFRAVIWKRAYENTFLHKQQRSPGQNCTHVLSVRRMRINNAQPPILGPIYCVDIDEFQQVWRKRIGQHRMRRHAQTL